jgi:hypothetical protein
MVFRGGDSLCGPCGSSVEGEVEGLKAHVGAECWSLVVERRKERRDLILVDPGVFE